VSTVVSYRLGAQLAGNSGGTTFPHKMLDCLARHVPCWRHVASRALPAAAPRAYLMGAVLRSVGATVAHGESENCRRPRLPRGYYGLLSPRMGMALTLAVPVELSRAGAAAPRCSAQTDPAHNRVL
jgi:hypothetical protein